MTTTLGTPTATYDRCTALHNPIVPARAVDAHAVRCIASTDHGLALLEFHLWIEPVGEREYRVGYASTISVGTYSITTYHPSEDGHTIRTLGTLHDSIQHTIDADVWATYFPDDDIHAVLRHVLGTPQLTA